MGRPGGGIMALRGHASIQGSTDIPTLFNLLPGYLPMPKAGEHDSLDEYVAEIASPDQKGFWANAKTLHGQPAQGLVGRRGDGGERLRVRVPAQADRRPRHVRTVMSMLRDEIDGYFLLGQNPAVGSAHGKMQRLGLSHLKWLVVRDLNMIESATFWKDGPEIETGELRTEDIDTEVFFFPAAAHVEKGGTFTQTQRMLQWHHKAVEPARATARASCEFFYQLGPEVRAAAGGVDRPARPADAGPDLGLPARRGRRDRRPRRCCGRSTAPTSPARRRASRSTRSTR